MLMLPRLGSGSANEPEQARDAVGTRNTYTPINIYIYIYITKFTVYNHVIQHTYTYLYTYKYVYIYITTPVYMYLLHGIALSLPWCMWLAMQHVCSVIAVLCDWMQRTYIIDTTH